MRIGFAASVAVTVAATSAQAAGDIHACKDATGRITYSNVPCPPQDVTPAPAVEASTYATPYGEWLGQVQFKESTSRSIAAKAVANITILIEPGGRVTGASNEAGCRALGIAAPSAVPTVLSLDLTLQYCHDAAFNRHYNGALALYTADRYAQLLLTSPPRPGQLPPATYDLRGTMRR